MCAAIGVDPLQTSRKESIGSVLGVGSFYFQLAVRVIEISRATRARNGGFIDVGEIKDIIGRGINAVDATEDDIVQAVKALSPLGSGFEVISIGKRNIVRSVPKELDSDQLVVLEAMQVCGYVSPVMLTLNFGWEKTRAQTVLDDLVKDSMVWVDTQSRETEYWSPSMLSNGSIEN